MSREDKPINGINLLQASIDANELVTYWVTPQVFESLLSRGSVYATGATNFMQIGSVRVYALLSPSFRAGAVKAPPAPPE